MFLKTSLKKTLKQIKKHKWLFLILFLTQLAFIIIFFLVQYRYQVAAVENYRDILLISQNVNYNTTQLQMGMPFTEDTVQLLNTWNLLKKNFTNLLIFSFLTFIVFNGFNWALTYYLTKKQNILKIWGKFAAFSAIFFFPYLFAIYLIFQSLLFYDNPFASAQLIIFISAIFMYFALLSFSFLDLKFKTIFRKTFWETGLKKFYWVLLVYAIIIAILSLIIYLLYLSSASWPLAIVAFLMILLILALITLRLFLLNSFQEL